MKFIQLSFFYVVIALSGCATLPDNVERDKSYALTPSDTSSPALSLFHTKKTPSSSDSAFMVMGEGLDAFVARIIMAEKAQRSIDLKTFIFKDDVIGNFVLESLLQAANRGVRVRLLLDDLWLGKQDKRFAAYDAHPNIEVRLFNPLARAQLQKSQYITRFGTVTRRMHNKAFIVDNDIMIVGGRNMAEEYFEAEPEVAFGDVDAVVIGPVVQEISASFDAFWNHTLAYPIQSLIKQKLTEEQIDAVRFDIAQTNKLHKDTPYANALRETALVQNMKSGTLQFFWGSAKAIADNPDKLINDRSRTDLHLSEQMSDLFEATTQEVIIFTPYFILGKEGAEGLAELVKKGVRVRVLTNSLASNNHAAVHAHYAKYRKKLLESGLEIYEVQAHPSQRSTEDEQKPQVLHAKMFVFDRKHTFIGSPNMDPRSWVENTEIGVALDSSELGGEIGQWFDSEVKKVAYAVKLDSEGKTIWQADNLTITKEPDSGIWKRLMNRLYRYLPIESQL